MLKLNSFFFFSADKGEKCYRRNFALISHLYSKNLVTLYATEKSAVPTMRTHEVLSSESPQQPNNAGLKRKQREIKKVLITIDNENKLI